MTAEIAVFNRSAIALAADSAVTTTSEFSEKIYNNADKLFELSKTHPVALMIYNNASICGAPWELLIKTFRKKLAASHHSHVNKYADSFFKFVQSNVNIITPDMQKKYFFGLYSEVILPPILQQVQNEDIANFLQSNNTFPSSSQYHSFIEKRALEKFNLLNNNEFFFDFTQEDMNCAKDEANKIALDICAQRIAPDITSTGINYPQSLIDALIDLFAVYTCKESDLTTYSGIVFAGYGEEEFYPAIESYHLYGVFNNKIMRPSGTHKNNKGQSIGIYPFAQDDEVHTFMRGCSNGVIKCVNDSVETSLLNVKQEVTTLLLSQNPNLNVSDIEAAFDASIASHHDYTHVALNNYVTLNHVQKVLSILGALAKVDLGYMAESLVNLTAFKRKVSNESDTVGGPIDVAVLSKGDGFVWIKRKHYFDKEVNYQYFNRQ